MRLVHIASLSRPSSSSTLNQIGSSRVAQYEGSTDTLVEQTRAVAAGLQRLAELFSDQLAAAIELGRASGLTDEELALELTEDVDWQTLARLIDYALRLQTRAALWRKLAAQDSGDELGAPLSVGFVDLVGYTALSQTLEPAQLAQLIARFEALTYDTVVERGGRVVKMIGDEVMYVADDVESAAMIALGLVDAVASDETLPGARAGLATGAVVAREGDYFGPTVNLAARLVGMARNEAVLTSGEVHDARRNMLRVLVIGILAVTALYLLVNIGYVAALGPSAAMSRVRRPGLSGSTLKAMTRVG